jgi:hypothetical protein
MNKIKLSLFPTASIVQPTDTIPILLNGGTFFDNRKITGQNFFAYYSVNPLTASFISGSTILVNQITASNGLFDQLTASNALITSLTSSFASIDEIASDVATINQITSSNALINELSSNIIVTDEITASFASIDTLIISASFANELTASNILVLNNLDIGKDLVQHIQNVIHVAINGTDTRIGLNKYSLIKPFLTLTEAQASASFGDTIVIHPGIITDTTVNLKDGVNWHFENGANWNASASADFIPMINDNGIAVNCVISGYGIFNLNDNGFQGRIIQVSNSGSKVVAHGTFNENGIYNGGAIVIVSSPGYVEIHGDVSGAYIGAATNLGGTLKIYGNITALTNGAYAFTTSDSISVYGDVVVTHPSGNIGVNGAGNVLISGNVSSSYGDGVNASGGITTILGNIYAGPNNNGSGINLFGGNIVVKNGNIIAPRPIRAGANNPFSCSLNGCELISSDINNSCIHFGGETLWSLTSYDCVYRPGISSSAAITADSTINVKVAQCLSTKVIEGTNVINSIASPLNVVDPGV